MHAVPSICWCYPKRQYWRWLDSSLGLHAIHWLHGYSSTCVTYKALNLVTPPCSTSPSLFSRFLYHTHYTLAMEGLVKVLAGIHLLPSSVLQLQLNQRCHLATLSKILIPRRLTLHHVSLFCVFMALTIMWIHSQCVHWLSPGLHTMIVGFVFAH